MRIIAIILALIIFSETVLSCAATDCCSHDESSKVLEFQEISACYDIDIEIPSNPDKSDDHESHCSPFCGCCFHASEIIDFELIYFNNTIVIDKGIFNYSFCISSSLNDGIWQPPRLA